MIEEFIELKKQEIEIKKKLEEASKKVLDYFHENEKLDKISIDNVSISYVKESESTSIDLPKVRNKEPELYAELLDIYPRITTRKPYLRVTFK